MSQAGRIVDGEASETDSEVEVELKPLPLSIKKQLAVTGEDLKSDDDDDMPLYNRTQNKKNNSESENSNSATPRLKVKTESLLHQKLYESNERTQKVLKNIAACEGMIEKMTSANKSLHNDQAMSSRHYTCQQQWEALIKFMECHPELAKGNAPNSTYASRTRNRDLWKDISVMLNSLGGYRTSEQWSKTWSDKKAALRKKVALRKQGWISQNGCLENVPELLPYEEKILSLIGSKDTISSSVSVNNIEEESVNGEAVSEEHEITFEPEIEPLDHSRSNRSRSPIQRNKSPRIRRDTKRRFRKQNTSSIQRGLVELEASRIAAERQQAKALAEISATLRDAVRMQSENMIKITEAFTACTTNMAQCFKIAMEAIKR